MILTTSYLPIKGFLDPLILCIYIKKVYPHSNILFKWQSLHLAKYSGRICKDTQILMYLEDRTHYKCNLLAIKTGISSCDSYLQNAKDTKEIGWEMRMQYKDMFFTRWAHFGSNLRIVANITSRHRFFDISRTTQRNLGGSSSFERYDLPAHSKLFPVNFRWDPGTEQ